MKHLVLHVCALMLSLSWIQGQEITTKTTKKEGLAVLVKDGAAPDIYVDGKKFDFPMELLDPNKIASVSVVKGEKAIKEYGAKNGVLLVETKKESAGENKPEIRIRGYAPEGEAPMIIIDGKKSDQETMKKLSPDGIESIEVFKDKKAAEKYNAPHGVVIITTKKGKGKK